MAQVPSKVADRLTTALKKFQPILSSARTRDVNESDTSIIVTDLLADMFGYDKYSEITREHAIRGTFCDLAVKLDNELQFLIEVKAIGLDLKDAHIKQAVDYAANQGVDWVILTNGTTWRVFKVIFGKPIDHEVVLDINLSSLNPRTSSHIESLYHITREGLLKGSLPAYQAQQQATSKFFLSAVILTTPVLDTIRRELRRFAPDVKINSDEIKAALINDVLKREVVEGEKADEARKKVQRATAKIERAKRPKESAQAQQETEPLSELTPSVESPS